MARLFFVTPVHRRFTLTRLCLEQRRWACDQIEARYGIRASCIVVGDDANLETAHDLGFATFERDNAWLGRKFNDGYQHAIEDHAATHLYAIGSDVWIDPGYFHKLPDPDTVRISRYYAVFPASGDRRAEMILRNPMGVSFIWPAELLEGRSRRHRYRPCDDELARGCDTSTFNTAARGARLDYHSTGHPLELVSFQSRNVQITNYDRLCRRWDAREVLVDPFDDLERFYPVMFVDRARGYYQADTDAADGQAPALARR